MQVSIAAGGAPLGGGAVSMSPPILTAGGSSPVGDTPPPITSLLPPSCTPSIALPQVNNHFITAVVQLRYSDFQASCNAKPKSVECHLHTLMC